MKTRHLLFGALLALAASPATAVIIPLSSPAGFGLDQGYGCLDGASGGCSDTFNTIYNLAGFWPGSGTLDVAALAAGTTTADLSVAVPISLFSQVAPAPATAVTFSTTSYSATAVPIIISSFGAFWSITQLGGATASVSGSHTDVPLAGIPLPFADTTGLSSLNCLVDKVSLAGQCGFTVGGGADFTFPIGPGLTLVDFVHTFNLATPEPSTAVLMLLGIAGIGLSGRRRA